MITIPEKHYVGYRSNPDLPLAFATPFGTDKAYEKRKETVDRWRSNPKEAEVLDNVLREGFCISRSVKRTGWNSGNVVWRVEDPRGFELEIPSTNFMKIVECTTIINGVIQGKCIWGRDGAMNVLLPESSQPYIDAVAATKRVESAKNIGAKDVKPGDLVRRKEGQTAVYLGSYHVLAFEHTSILDYRKGRREEGVNAAAAKKRYLFEPAGGSGSGELIFGSSKLDVSEIIESCSVQVDPEHVCNRVNSIRTRGQLVDVSRGYHVSTKAAKDITVQLVNTDPIDVHEYPHPIYFLSADGENFFMFEQKREEYSGYGYARTTKVYAYTGPSNPRAFYEQLDWEYTHTRDSTKILWSEVGQKYQWYKLEITVGDRKVVPFA